ncbi:hypothetical protein Slin_0561 [Spirosoma linguale DSM 74]|uniref:Uncharacterized protein n=1 Tax=Spirosoma linguale (strain ATCC 33905 / DSM 74 / LMG 10896 / Claus 1) TaxID=504472 RepID=D2QFE8_SPILD|nr:hypothetical protein Slin_0561 [Spirosoma linguale DSM 74]
MKGGEGLEKENSVRAASERSVAVLKKVVYS